MKENGFSLNSLIQKTRQNILTNDELNFFNERLLLLGYREEDMEHYEKLFSLKNTLGFTVNSDFPKIVESQLPLGIYNAAYSIELSAVEDFIIEIEAIIQNI